jgi:hypothetical protein
MYFILSVLLYSSVRSSTEPKSKTFYAFFAWRLRRERIMSWSHLSACLSTCFNSRTTGRIRKNFIPMLCQWWLPPNRTVKYPKISNNKIADEETCEVGPNSRRVKWTLVAEDRTISQVKTIAWAVHITTTVKCYNYGNFNFWTFETHNFSIFGIVPLTIEN